MAEVSAPSSAGKTTKKRATRISTKIDMTPMVDLAFLLITFFMLTTTFSKPQAMEINMPDQSEETAKISEKRTLTLILGKDNRVFHYQGDNEPGQTDFSAEGLRKLLLERKNEVQAATGKDMIVIVKIMDDANFENMVDVEDELHITGIRRHAIVAMTEEDTQMLEQKGLI